MQPPQESMGSAANIWFRLIVPATAAFVVTVLALVATIFGDPSAPIHGVIDRYANRVLLIEFAVIGLLFVVALITDNRRTVTRANSLANTADTDNAARDREITTEKT